MASSKEAILIVDDERPVAEAHADLVSQCGYLPIVETDPLKVIERLEQDNLIQVVLLDIRMPQRSGLELLSELRYRFPSVGVIMATVVNDVSYAVESIKSGAFNYLLKPVQLESLRKVLTAYKSLRPKCYKNDSRFSKFITADPSIHQMFEKLIPFASQKVSLLIEGETGTGKEIVANLVHTLSPRVKAPFIPVNMAAISDSLFESELFGHEKGAFTGAAVSRVGLLEAAGGGTLFLDEIGELDLEQQAKLLRVLQDGKYRRVGGTTLIDSQARFIFATNRNLRQEAEEGRFRYDLFYRIGMHTVTVPALRNRPIDIDCLADHFLRKYASQYGRQIEGFTEEASELLRRYPFPGNVRELEGIVSSCVLLEEGLFVQPSTLPVEVSQFEPVKTPIEFHSLDLKGLRKKAIYRVLDECGGNRTEAAERLGIARGSLSRILKRLKSEEEASASG